MLNEIFNYASILLTEIFHIIWFAEFADWIRFAWFVFCLIGIFSTFFAASNLYARKTKNFKKGFIFNYITNLLGYTFFGGISCLAIYISVFLEKIFLSPA
jgi:hypothetical protein